MGKASSSKKVARAAGLGGSRAYGSRPPWGYYFAVLALLVLGVIGVYNSREYRDAKITAAGSGQPAVHMSTPWFEGYAIDACGKLLPPIKTTKDPYGITTHGDGVIYINPTTKSAAGKNATLGKFASAVGMLLNASELEVPGGRLYQTGDSCEGKPGEVFVETWGSPQEPVQDGYLQTKKGSTQGREDTCNPDCESGVRLENDQLVTIAFLPAPPKHGTPDILQPPASVISKVTQLVSTGGSTTTTAPAVLPSTSTTTAQSATTTAKGATTTAVPGAPTSTRATGTTTTSTATTTVKPTTTT
jgi:hypothetical protein